MLAALLDLLQQIPRYRELAARPHGRVLLLRAARPCVLAGVHAETRRPLLVLTARVDTARALAEQLRAWTAVPGAVRHFPEPAPLPFEHAAWGEESRRGRLSTLATLAAWTAPAPPPPPVPGPPAHAPAHATEFALDEEALAAVEPAAADEFEPAPIVVASARALVQKTLPRREFVSATRTLRIGQQVVLEKLLTHWVSAGYEPAAVVETPGSFSRRGGIVDIFPPALPGAVRIELFGDEIESLRMFDPATQRSHTPLENLVIPPAREGLPRALERVPAAMAAPDDAELLARGTAFPAIEFYLPLLYSQPGSLLQYLPDNSLIAIDEPDEFAAAVRELERQAADQRRDWIALQQDSGAAGAVSAWPLPFLGWDEVQAALDGRATLAMLSGSLGPGDEQEPPADNAAASHAAASHAAGGRAAGGRAAAGEAAGPLTPHPAPGALQPAALFDLSAAFAPGPHFGGQIKPTLDHLRKARAARERAVVVSRQAERMADLWAESEPALGVHAEIKELPPRGTLTFVKGALAEGFVLRSTGDAGVPLPGVLLHLLSDAELFGWFRPEPHRKRTPRRIAPETFFSDMRPGDYVVHLEHGVGRFGGLVRRMLDGIEREYLLVEYAGGDVLYVPGHHADRLSRYVGADAHPPALHRLGTAEWSQVRQRAEAAAAEVAQELLDLYSARAQAPGHAFGADTPWQHELEGSFPYVETEDQLRAIVEVKRDMEAPRPMDRLICGDVGYGKTEVALRAAFKAVQDGKQVAVLVPTTVLAQQHFNTFSERLRPFPVVVEMLSRFRSRQEQQQILEGLQSGRIDIVVGTHRMLGADVQFKDLGLLITDEEQRFGVMHKERLKQLRTELDVLTMTATPIPRTLYMSLVGARDVSMIETAPEERLPVQTYLGEYSERIVRQAVLRELDRGGQVFYVHNRVQGIEQIARLLRGLVPEARLGIAHGQMDEDELERVMVAFGNDEVDVLLCTSIIESGLDIPNANTLIVDHADWFGLAQLYQLRGRVGRGATRAYAYLLYDRDSNLSHEARQRLAAIAEARELGAGYTIAMRDLEIRGAGELLGARQSGHISAVGFDMYTRLLARAVHKLKAAQAEGGAPAVPAPGVAQPQEVVPELVTIDLPWDVLIPPEYVPDDALRLQLYRRLAGLGSLEQIDEIASELADRFGPLPEAVDHLLYQLRLKLLATRAGVEAIGVEDGQIALRLPGEMLEAIDRAGLQRALGPGVRVTRTHVWMARDLPVEQWSNEIVQVLEKLHKRVGVRPAQGATRA